MKDCMNGEKVNSMYKSGSVVSVQKVVISA